MRAWRSWDRRMRIFAGAAPVIALASVAYAVILRFGIFGDQAVTAIDDIGEAVAAGIPSPARPGAATPAAGKERLRWALMSPSTRLWAAGGGAWGIYHGGLPLSG